MCATEHNALPCSGVMSENAQNRMHFFLLCAKAHRKSCDGRGYSPSRRSGPRTPVAYTGIRGRNESAARRSVSAFHDREKHMYKYGSFSKPLMWFMALLLTAFVAGCGGGDDGAAAPSAAGAVCTGTAADCVALGTAGGTFVILSTAGITNTGSHTTAITGNIGTSPITAAAMNDVFCSEITGTMYGVNAAYVGDGVDVTCFAGGPPPNANKDLVDNAVLDATAAFGIADAKIPGAGNTNLGTRGKLPG